MANWKWMLPASGTAVPGLTYTVSSKSSEDASYPATNVVLYVHQLRTWRTTALGSQWIIGDLAAAKVPLALYVGNANFPTGSLDISSSATFASDINNIFTNSAIPKDPRRKGRRCGWLDFPGNALSKRYWRFTPTGTPDAAAAYYETGVLAIADASGLLTFDDNPAPPWRSVRMHAHTRIAFASGGEDVVEDGQPYMEFTFGSTKYRRAGGSTILTQLYSILDAGPAAPVIFWENRGNVEQAYVVRRVGEMPVEEQFVTFGATVTLREPI